ncbi:hypothetical protein BIW11_01332 [Tropilaelaps mercedesae]|uniref:Uncharacterized protein n=1 Tax=Tropilaelaps mercedesae TaxID=418985 RepID=A0A1V9XFG3_9ACAR|nr:hypothetical protein BIW11_01332 [Tropilaelaps mercedesae]
MVLRREAAAEGRLGLAGRGPRLRRRTNALTSTVLATQIVFLLTVALCPPAEAIPKNGFHHHKNNTLTGFSDILYGFAKIVSFPTYNEGLRFGVSSISALVSLLLVFGIAPVIWMALRFCGSERVPVGWDAFPRRYRRPAEVQTSCGGSFCAGSLGTTPSEIEDRVT